MALDYSVAVLHETRATGFKKYSYTAFPGTRAALAMKVKQTLTYAKITKACEV